MTLVFLLGLGSLAVAGLDSGLAVWDRSQRPVSEPMDPALEEMFKSPPMFQVGTLAPDFALPSLEGHSVRLSDFRGHKPVLLTLSSFG